MTTVDDLSDDRRRTLLNRLIKGGDLDELGRDYHLVVPKRLNLQFQCPNCNKEFSSRLMTKDIKGMNKYVTCPNCDKKAYVDTIGAPVTAARSTLEDLDD